LEGLLQNSLRHSPGDLRNQPLLEAIVLRSGAVVRPFEHIERRSMGNPPGFTADQSVPGRRGRYGNMKHYRPPMSSSHGTLPASWVQLSQATAGVVEDEDDVTADDGLGMQDDAGFDDDDAGAGSEAFDEDADADDDDDQDDGEEGG